jgi:hypothetical protein
LAAIFKAEIATACCPPESARLMAARVLLESETLIQKSSICCVRPYKNTSA